MSEIMRRRASDNVYLHRDFHNALNIGLDYLNKHFGRGAVVEYLRQFAKSFYAPLSRKLRRRGLSALKAHLEHLYALENGTIRVVCARDELRFESEYCPAVKHIGKMKEKVSPFFIETERTIYEAVCEGTPFAYELVSYDPKTGKSVQRFYRRKK